MKITRNMIYRPSIASDELTIFTMNEYLVYEMIRGVIKSLARKWRKGTYDSEKAVICYYRVATEAAKVYNRLYGSLYGGNPFTVTDRWTTAVDLEEHFRENVEENAA